MCIEALEKAQEYKDCLFYLVDDGSCDGTEQILLNCNLNKEVVIYQSNNGLRDVIIDFFEYIKNKDFNFMAKIDNDCRVPKNWLNNMIEVFNKTDADILSPNVSPSNAAFFYGEDDLEHKGYRPSEIVGGLWMRPSLIKDLEFSKYETYGLTGAISILKQIVTEKDANVGWVTDVLVEDIGHWSGEHEEHIKSREHLEYSLEVGRNIAWKI